MKILITGGSGFIGRNLAEYLIKSHEVLKPTHNELELTDEDAVGNYFKQNNIDIVIHCAVKSGHRNAIDTSNQLYNNTRIFFNIVRNSDRFEKMIFISSGAVYDMRHYIPKMKEDYFDQYVPVDEHGFSKYISAKYIQSVDNIVELRLFGVFGKYEDYSIRFISNAICKTFFNLPITIKQNRLFDYLYIEDLMPVIDYFISNKSNFKCFNVTPDRSIELRILAEKVRYISGKDLPILITQEGMGSEYSGENGTLKTEMTKLFFTPIDEAISKLYNWYHNNRRYINRQLLLVDK